MRRPLRSAEELAQIGRRSPAVRGLAERLQAEVPGVEVHADGTGACVYKVYLSGRTGSFESFLWIHEPLEGGYVGWEHVPGLAEACRSHFDRLVKNSSNANGSYLREDVTADEIVAAVRGFVGDATPAG